MTVILSRHPASRVAGGNVISVASGKGGVGKTWFAITLAHCLSRAGRHILLFDGDLGLANVDIQLGLTPQRDLSAVLAERARLADVVLPFPAGGFDVVAGRSGSGSLAALPDSHLAQLRDEVFGLAAHYQNAVLDLGAGVDSAVRVLTATDGICLVVTTEEPTALTDAYAFIKLTVARAPNVDIRIVVNRVTTHRDGQHTYATLARACENFLRFTPRLAGIVRQDTHVRDAIRHQTPLMTRFPTCPAAEDVEEIARQLVETG